MFSLNTPAVNLYRQTRRLTIASSPSAANTCKPFGGARQQLPRRGRQAELIEQLLLRQTIRQTREDVAVDEGAVSRQFARQRGFNQRSISAVMTLF